MTRGVLVAAVLAALVAATPASAATYNVTTEADSTGACPATAAAPCTLRTAVATAMGNKESPDVINLPAGDYLLSNGSLDIASAGDDITILGLGADLTTITGGGKTRVFAVGGGRTTTTVTLERLTIRHGRAGAGVGGNIAAFAASLTLRHVRVTDGQAARGGGIAYSQGSLVADHVLIDGNRAVGVASPAGPTGDGGGILADVNSALQLSDSTVTANTALAGGGIMSRNAASGQLTRVTVAGNSASASLGGGLEVVGDSTRPTAQGSIVANNTGAKGLAGNCAGVLPVDGGGNLESGTDCGFVSAASRQNPNTGLATALVNDGGMLPVLPISADSPARDLAGPCKGTDQRDVTRPNGAACDAGAYEYVPPPPPEASPTPTPTATPTPTPTTPQTQSQTPAPEFHKSVVVRVVSGKIRVRLPGSSRFVELDGTQSIPLRSVVDAKKGVLELTSVPRNGATPETAKFWAGIFRITQPGSTTDVALWEQMRPCPGITRAARAAAKKPKTRRLWGDGKGSFRTTGRYSSATVRGTKWIVQDSCSGTLTRVTQGAVTVRDKIARKTVVVRAGKRYLARRPRR